MLVDVDRPRASRGMAVLGDECDVCPLAPDGIEVLVDLGLDVLGVLCEGFVGDDEDALTMAMMGSGIGGAFDQVEGFDWGIGMETDGFADVFREEGFGQIGDEQGRGWLSVWNTTHGDERDRPEGMGKGLDVLGEGVAGHGIAEDDVDEDERVSDEGDLIEGRWAIHGEVSVVAGISADFDHHLRDFGIVVHDEDHRLRSRWVARKSALRSLTAAWSSSRRGYSAIWIRIARAP
jgi:hypothetical protein